MLLILFLGGAVAYWLFTPSAPEQKMRPGELPVIGGRARLGGQGAGADEEQRAGRPAGERQRLRQIVAKDILGPTISADGKSIYYIDRSNGHILKSDLDGEGEESVTTLTILEAYDAVWSPRKTQVAISYHESGSTKKFLSSAATGTPSRFLPPDLISVVWSPDGRELAYLLPQGSETRLVIADPALRQTRTVYTTPVPDFTLAWASRNVILLVSRPSGLAPSLVLRLDLQSRRAEPFIASLRGVAALTSPDGSGVLYSQSSENGSASALAFRRFGDGAVLPLNIVTIAEKCAFAAAAPPRVFCGVPQGIIQSPSPDAWYRGTVSFTDAIVEVNLESGAAVTRMEREASLDVVSPFVSKDNGYLFFQDKKTGTLWRLTLAE